MLASDDYIAALLGKPQRDGSPDPAVTGRARNESNLVLKTSHA